MYAVGTRFGSHRRGECFESFDAGLDRDTPVVAGDVELQPAAAPDRSRRVE